MAKPRAASRSAKKAPRAASRVTAPVPGSELRITRAALEAAGPCDLVSLLDDAAAAGTGAVTGALVTKEGDMVFPEGWTDAHTRRVAAHPRVLRFLARAGLIPVSPEEAAAAILARGGRVGHRAPFLGVVR